MKQNILYLGDAVQEDGIEVDKKKVALVRNWEPPSTVTRVQSFLGLCNYYWIFAEIFATIASSLSYLRRKKVRFTWEDKRSQAFKTLKGKLSTALFLRCADPNLPYELSTDASGTGVRAFLS